MALRIYLSLFLLLFICNIGYAQTQEVESERKTRWSFYILNSAHLETLNGTDNDTWSKIGIGTELKFQINSNIGINTRLSYRAWDQFGFDKRVLPLSLGPSYRFGSKSAVGVELSAGAGPTLIVGNDYASIFGSFDVGVGVFIPVWSNKELFIKSAFAQGMSFNSPFNYLDFCIGIRL